MHNYFTVLYPDPKAWLSAMSSRASNLNYLVLLRMPFLQKFSSALMGFYQHFSKGCINYTKTWL